MNDAVNEPIKTPEMLSVEIQAIISEHGWDIEKCHVLLDRLLCSTLRSMGYGDAMDKYEGVEKWCA